MKNRSKFIATIMIFPILLSSGAIAETYQRPEMMMPTKWDGAMASGATVQISAEWWKRFGSTELNELMSQALVANHDLSAAVHRIQQARAAAGMVDANLFPTIDISLDAKRVRTSSGSDTSGGTRRIGALTASYEIDLWGKNAAEREAARARINYSVYDRDAVALVLQADVASNYFQALALKERLALKAQNLAAAQEILKLVESRFNKGADTALEVSQQRTEVLTIEAQIPSLEQELGTKLTALAVLLGKTPQEFAIKSESLEGLTVPLVPGYMPPELLERRPDIKRAEASLIAGNADLVAARAALYPSLDLTASTVATGVFSSGSSVVTTLALSLAQTIFDGGKLRSQAEKYDAIKSELIDQYLQSVLTGLKEVQDSYGSIKSSTLRQEILSKAMLEARETYRIALAKYRTGATSMLALLDSQRTRLDADDNYVQANLTQLTAMTELFKMLGGGWESDVSNQPVR